MSDADSLLHELRTLDPRVIRLWVDRFEDLVVQLPDEAAPRAVRPLRAFPLSHRDRHIVLRGADGAEVGLIEDLNELDRESGAALRKCIDCMYVIPQIIRIHSIELRNQIPTWEVNTDRGPRTIEIRSTRRDLHVTERGQIIVRDADGNQYEISDRRTLDPASRALLESVV